MKIRAIAASLSILAVVAVTETAHAASTSPGKHAVYASTAAAVIGDPPTTVLTATIAKGKKKRVLEVEVSATIVDDEAGTLTLIPTVNGLAILEPIAGGGIDNPGSHFCSAAPCSVSFEYWLDLDAAEAAQPGVFIKEPLVIAVQAGFGLMGFDKPPASGVVSLRARLQKK